MRDDSDKAAKQPLDEPKQTKPSLPCPSPPEEERGTHRRVSEVQGFKARTGSGNSLPGGRPGDGVGSSHDEIDPFFQRIDWRSFLVTTALAFAVYLCTLAPETTLGDSGILSTAAKYGGVGSPPGFPVGTVYSWAFANLLPISNIARRVAVGSAVAAALAAGLVALMVSRAGAMLLENNPAFTARKPVEQHLLRGVCGFVAGMALALSRSVWSMAVVPETWALSLLLCTALLCLLMRWSGTPDRRRFLYAAAFVYALLLTGNQELFVLLPALLVVGLFNAHDLGRDLALLTSTLAVTTWGLSVLGLWRWPVSDMLQGPALLVAFVLVGVAGVIVALKTRRVGSEWLSVGVCSCVFLLGLGFYLYLPPVSMTNPPSNWAYTRTPEGFIHGITRGQFERWHPTDELGRCIEQLWILFRETGRQYGWLHLLFAVLPLGLLRQTKGYARNWMLGLLAALLCAGPVLITLLNPPADRASIDLIAPYFGPMDVVLALFTGLGLLVAGNWAANSRPARLSPHPPI